MTGISLFRSAIALFVLAFLASCAEVPVTPSTTAASVAPTPPPGYWADDGLPGAPKIIVSISEQRAYFFKGKRLIGESTVSTGKAGFSTPPGHHRVVWKNIDHISTRFGDYVDDFGNVVKANVDSRKDRRPPGTRFQGAPMPFAMFFRGGYAMHQGYVPPYAASHGCIRLPRGMAEVFFNAAPYGTPVIVKQEPFMRRVTAPSLASDASAPAPVLVQQPSIAPPPVRSTYARSTVPAPAPAPLRSPSPAPVRPSYLRSTVPAPASVRPPAPAPVRSPAPAVVRRTYLRSTVPASATVRSPAPAPAPVRSPSPAPVRPTSLRSTAPPQVPVRSPAAVRYTAPASVRPKPTPIPALSPAPGPGRSRIPVRRPAPSPTPTPARR